MMAKEKKLTKAEHLEMELNHEQVASLKLQKELLLEKKANKLLKIKIAELENQRMIQVMNNNLDSMVNRIAQADKEVKDFNEKVKTKYKLKGSFGINPDTGSIIED
jgi:hypothetical protein